MIFAIINLLIGIFTLIGILIIINKFDHQKQ